MLSTKHTGELVNTGRKHYATKEDIQKPDVIVEYNATMGGVDNLSRVIVPYCLQRKGIKWYRKIAELFLEICLYNAYIEFTKLNPDTGITQLKFRENIVNTIIMFHKNDTHSYRTGRNVIANEFQNPLRISEKHFIRLIPTPPGSKRKRRRCVRCVSRKKRTDTSYECRECKVALCMEPCFPIYH